MRIDVYRAVKDGQCHIIALSESEARAILDQYHGYCVEEDDAWSVEVTTEDVQIVDGQWAETEPPHISWDCPECGRIHDTDLDPGESNPALWFCERGYGPSGRDSLPSAFFLVRRSEPESR